MPLNTYSAKGYGSGWNVASPRYADLSNAKAWAIQVTNSTAADINAGKLEIETCNADPNDHCVPDGNWQPLIENPFCENAPGVPAELDLSHSPVPAHSMCQYSVACPEQFIRVVGAPAGLDVILFVTQQWRSGIPGNPNYFGPSHPAIPPIFTSAPLTVPATAPAPATAPVTGRAARGPAPAAPRAPAE